MITSRNSFCFIVSPASFCLEFVSCELLLLFESEDAFPIVLHADHDPALFFCFIVKCLRECSDFGVRQPLRWSICIFTLSIIMQYDHREALAGAGFCVFEHLLIAGGISYGKIR